MDPDSAAIDIPLQECSSPSASSKFLSGKRANASRASSSPAPPSTLLQAIRSALRGADPESPKSLSHDGLADIQERSTHFVSNGAEESLAWSDTAVCWSRGGVIQRYWDFKDQDETVRWACKGKLEQTSSEAPLNNHASRPEPSATPKSHSITSSTDITSPESNFGPFWKWRAENRKRPGLPLAVDAVYIFLRTSLRIFLMDGTDFTVSLPFTVRKAWAIWPHGVMIQRTVDRKEVEEAEALDEYLLPSLFTLTSPFVELASVGITNGIVGTPGSTKMVLVDEEDLSNRALESVEATEMVVHVGDHWAKTPETVVVTVDSASSKLSIWRYAAIPPVDLPPPLMSDRNSSDGRPHAFDEHPSLLQTGTANEQMTSKGQMSSSSTTSSLATMLANIKTDFLADGEAYGGLNTSARQDTSTALPQTDTAGHVPVARIPEAHGRMEAACWMQRLHVETIAASDAANWGTAIVRTFDHRTEDTQERFLLAVCFPGSALLLMFLCTSMEDRRLSVTLAARMSGTSIARVNCLRRDVFDLLVVDPGKAAHIVTYGLRQMPIQLSRPQTSLMVVDNRPHDIAQLVEDIQYTVIIVFGDGSRWRANFDLDFGDDITVACLRTLSMTLPGDCFYSLQLRYLQRWQREGRTIAFGRSFECFRLALSEVFRFPIRSNCGVDPNDPWSSLGRSASQNRFIDDPALDHLHLPPNLRSSAPAKATETPHELLCPTLNSLHLLAEDFRQTLSTEERVFTLAPLLFDMASVIRPEWADYWKRVIPDVIDAWPSPLDIDTAHLNDTLPVWPPDLTSMLHVRLHESSPQPGPHGRNLGSQWNIVPSYAHGKTETIPALAYFSRIFLTMRASSEVKNTRIRAHQGISIMLNLSPTERFDNIPMSLSAPLLEAVRTLQVIPVAGWWPEAYRLTGRNDYAQISEHEQEPLVEHSSPKLPMGSSEARMTVTGIVKEARSASVGEIVRVSGVELDQEGFAESRFGKDRRLEEVARMLRSSEIPIVKMLEQPEASEHETLREQQNTLVRTSERTQALPYGRAMFTFGTISFLNRESFIIPKMEYSIRLVPPNTTIGPEMNRIPKASVEWGEFHNGVAAGLRIVPTAKGVESSWIAFNKPSELTSQHAGFLMALGLTGHLKGMLTWQTFGYLTPKHEQTSIGVLLGLSAAHVGSGDEHVTKLLAVHAPALLPHREVDLNVPLITQTAALAGIGLLYMGTKKRHMAEVLLNEIQRKDLTQPDLTNDHREAYTLASGIAFGMVMLARGTNIPSDNDLVERLRMLIHGQPPTGSSQAPSFDMTLTSPAATIAISLMFLRTERVDIADILALPDATLELHRIQPAMLLVRALGKALIMWDSIEASPGWIESQVPPQLIEAMNAHIEGKTVDDTLELAYLNIIAGACFALALKTAGSHSPAAHRCVFASYVHFSKITSFSGIVFEQRVRRAVVRECLNLLSVSMSIIMAGSGDLVTLRKLRAAYGSYAPEPLGRYGGNTANHMAIGMLFLGTGRYTLGTSNAAIASMVAAFYPRFAQFSSDNKCYLQALRHLWVLAVEPRCVVARDVDTGEIVNVPFKARVARPGAEEVLFTSRTPELVPDIELVKSLKIETPRYWPAYVDMSTTRPYRSNFIRNQTIWVKRRSAFLSYNDDPSGARCLLVRSHMSTADAATLEVPESATLQRTDQSNLMPFVSSFSSDPLFLATADRLCRESPDATEAERVFAAYCRAALQDALFQDKPHTLQTHLNLLHTRFLRPSSRVFQLRAHHARFCDVFYQNTYDHCFSGKSENNTRPPLLRPGTTASAVQAIDAPLEAVRQHPLFRRALGQYARGERVEGGDELLLNGVTIDRALSWYLLRESVPPPTVLGLLRMMAEQAHTESIQSDPPVDVHVIDEGIKLVIHRVGTSMTASIGGKWSMRSLDEIIAGWSSAGV